MLLQWLCDKDMIALAMGNKCVASTRLNIATRRQNPQLVILRVLLFTHRALSIT